MRPVNWTLEARSDVARIHDYLAQFNPRAAARIAAELLHSTDMLKRLPELGRPAADDTRELVVRRQYIVAYETGPAGTFVLRVWHGAQDRPGSKPPVSSQ